MLLLKEDPGSAAQAERGSCWILRFDEVVTSTAIPTQWLWCAVDLHGVVLDTLVQSHRYAKGAKRLLRKLLKRRCH